MNISQFIIEPITLFDKFQVFTTSDGTLEIANTDKDLLLQNRMTGYYSKVNMNEFATFIKKIFPTEEEQIDILQHLFENTL